MRTGVRPLQARIYIYIAGIMLAALVLRLFLVLTHENYLGVDIGAYLISAQQVRGLANAVDFTRPPLAPGWLLVPFIETLGMDIGYKVFQAFFSVLTIPAVYLLTSQFTSRRVALIAAAFVAVDVAHAEMLVTGALPLIGYGLIGLGLWAIGKILTEDPSRIHILALIFVIPLLVFINMTTAGIAMIAFPVFAGVVMYYKRPPRVQVVHLVGAWGIGAGFSLLALPWYAQVAPGASNLVYGDSLFHLLAMGREGWYVVILGSILGAFALWKGQDARLKALGAVVIVFSLFAGIWSDDEGIMNISFRGQYFVVMLAYPILAWAIVRYIPHFRRYNTAIFTVAIIAALFLYVQAFHSQAYYSDQITSDTASALEYLKQNDPQAGVIVNTFSMGLAVTALNGVNAPIVWDSNPPERWAEDYEYVKCVLGWTSDCSPRIAAYRLGVSYALLDTSFPDRNSTAVFAAPPKPWEVTAQAPWLTLVYERGDTQLWKIKNTGS